MLQFASAEVKNDRELMLAGRHREQDTWSSKAAALIDGDLRLDSTLKYNHKLSLVALCAIHSEALS